MIKKIITSIAIISFGSLFAAEYNIFISQNDNYEIVDENGWVEETEYTDWVNNGNSFNCSYLPLASDYHNETTFNQTETCQQEQTRDKNIYLRDPDSNNETLISTTEETQTISVDNILTDVYGTYASTTCLDIKNHNGDIGDGTYTINISSGEETVYCDMTNGGWTLLLSTGSDIYATTITTLNLNKNNPPTTLNHEYYDYYPYINDFLSVLSTDTTIKFHCEDIINSTEVTYYQRNINNYLTYFNMTSDPYSGNIECATDENFSSNYSNLVSVCVHGNDSLHRYYKSAITEYGFAFYGANNPATLRHCGSAWNGDQSAQSQGYIWFK